MRRGRWDPCLCSAIWSFQTVQSPLVHLLVRELLLNPFLMMQPQQHLHKYYVPKQHLVFLVSFHFLVTTLPEERFFIRTYLIAYNTFLASTWANLFIWIALHIHLNRGNLIAMHLLTENPWVLCRSFRCWKLFMHILVLDESCS